MTDFVLLRKKMQESGMPFSTIAERAGMKRETLYHRFNGVGKFTALEISGLCKTLRIAKKEREAIFFANEVE